MYYEGTKRWTYTVGVNFCYDFLYGFLIPHIILLEGLLQLLHRNVPDVDEKKYIFFSKRKILDNEESVEELYLHHYKEKVLVQQILVK